DYTDYSYIDDDGESKVLSAISDNIPDRIHGSLLFAQSFVRGRVWHKGEFVPIESISIIGSKITKLEFSNKEKTEPDHIHDRQVLAFTDAGNNVIKNMLVGVVGSGGTGSCVIEQLARLGVRKIIAVDPDNFEESNLSRIYGSCYEDTKRNDLLKVRIVERHVEEISPTINFDGMPNSVVERQTLHDLRSCDMVFCCTDTDWSRSVLNELSYQYLIPIIDMGNKIVVSDGEIKTASGRVIVLRPDHPCLWCYEQLSSERITAESMPRRDRERLQKQKYVMGMDVKEPSVVSLNTVVAGLAVTEYINLATGFMGEARGFGRQVYDILEGTVFKSSISPKSTCVCQRCRALGDGRHVSGVVEAIAS
ncbi:MAG: HesA/MoeB/ThiF family protein, partial [Nitrososphaera sp.]